MSTRMSRTAGCNFLLQPSGRLHLKGRGQEVSGDVKSQLSLRKWSVLSVLQMNKIATRVGYRVRDWKEKQCPHDECSVASSCNGNECFSICFMDYFFFFYLLTFGNKSSSCLFILSILNGYRDWIYI